MNPLDAVLHAIAARQLGLLTRVDILRAGGTDKYIAACLERRRWQQLQDGVYLTGSSPPTWLQRQLAACLAAGPNAVGSHRAAVAVWWLDGGRESVVELTAAQPYCPRPHGVVLHRTIRWDPVDRTVHRLIPVTSVNRTLIDYGAVAPRLLVERAVEDAFNRRLTTEGALRRRLAQVGGRGCRGAGVLRRVLDERPLGKPARSGFEVILRDLLRQFGLDDGLWRNYEIRDKTGRIVAEVDLADPIRRIALEADGGRWHTTRRARLRDLERQELLESLGWTVIRFTWDEVVHHPERAIARVRTVLCASSPV